MKPHYIHKLISQGEHQQLDFKFEIADSKKIAKTFSAFANTDGGKLLIGVKDNGNIAGVRSEEEFYMAEAAATMYCKPPITFKSNQDRQFNPDIRESFSKINNGFMVGFETSR